MCRFASMVVLRNTDVLWYPFVDSHSRILKLAGLRDCRDDAAYRDPPWAYIEIVEGTYIPDPHPHGIPDWLDRRHEAECMSAYARLLKREAEGGKVEWGDGSWMRGRRVNGEWVGPRTKEAANGHGWFCEGTQDGMLDGICRQYAPGWQIEGTLVRGWRDGPHAEFDLETRRWRKTVFKSGELVPGSTREGVLPSAVY